ncbi:hypothetical protein ON010_g955 [Phytophthora cinnamomi]|nr:hypothetical protein ON010_g955 [Phytophthora cinnamomi]
MPPVSFQSIAHIGTATSILSMDAVNFLIDPTFDNSGDFNQELGNFNQASGFVFVKTDDPTLGIEDLPVVDAILLSHEDHVDNLDASGRTMLNGRHVFTTLNGVKNLASPCPGSWAYFKESVEDVRAELATQRSVTAAPGAGGSRPEVGGSPNVAEWFSVQQHLFAVALQSIAGEVRRPHHVLHVYELAGGAAVVHFDLVVLDGHRWAGRRPQRLVREAVYGDDERARDAADGAGLRLEHGGRLLVHFRAVWPRHAGRPQRNRS